MEHNTKLFALLHKFDCSQDPVVIAVYHTYGLAVTALAYEADRFADEFDMWDAMKMEEENSSNYFLAKISFPDGTTEDEFWIQNIEYKYTCDYKFIKANNENVKLFEWKNKLIKDHV